MSQSQPSLRDSFEHQFVDNIMSLVGLSIIWFGWESNHNWVLYLSLALGLIAATHRYSRWKEFFFERKDSVNINKAPLRAFTKNNPFLVTTIILLIICNIIAFKNPLYSFNPNSSAIKWTNYDRREKSLAIAFKNGEPFFYIYKEVPYNVYLDFKNATSPGEFFNESIRDTYSYVRCDGDDDYR